VRVRFNFGASSTLAEQILATRRADVFLSADVRQMDRVQRAGRVVPGTRRQPLSNVLVGVVPAGEPLLTPVDLATDTVRSLSLAHPSAVPAGRYARAWLQAEGLWDDVAHKVAPAVDVRAALAAVESGAAEAGIVYATDAARSSRVRVAFEVRGETAPPIAYSAAALEPDSARARELLAFLGGDRARAVFTELGFIVLPEEP
jgi:molybdate transport system substrate-binding protein